ncbi:hypothetical protein CHCC20488_0156 [Bacillus paralicheniformis]|uniref:Uncharacterized protein n=1 Tax=Bacillus paralicheniformis TaxID=1648923 RepID=A0A6N2GV09_9BACI|nr:hypothetical protein SC10_B2orf03039 [Bacillus paralicheniformis]OLF87897.1 hypothetical protein B4121_4349 [Bacillus paralicheniformis]OLG07391.1 hypothetical protein B4125_1572 [Bacillus paralicheniformis]TWJ55943.1 hypothetical protein CHCC5022_1071 [Bacillus paralicheniformis]TWJ62270.1 hypothetical protein CHCC5021_1737 [Bacillus paralicheniformis]
MNPTYSNFRKEKTAKLIDGMGGLMNLQKIPLDFQGFFVS